MKRVFRRPSPAMVVAIVALIAALGGTAIGAAFVTKKQSKKIAKNQVNKLAPGLSVASAKSADSATSATTAGRAQNVLAASVNSSGTLLHATDPGITSSGSGGNYDVTFPRDITTCSFVAGGKAGGREINSFQSGPNNNVAVLSFNSGGTASAVAFDLIVVC
jgi:hypothetical protein